MDRAQLDRKIVDESVTGTTWQLPDQDGKGATGLGRPPALAPPGLLAAAAAQCRRWGWAISLTGSRILLTTGSQVGAVELAAELAAEVQRFLLTRLLAGPVIALPGTPRRWLLLVASAERVPQATVDRLAGRGGITHRAGALVPLPPSRLACGQVTWQVPPALVEPWLPPLTAISAAVRSITDPPGTP